MGMKQVAGVIRLILVLSLAALLAGCGGGGGGSSSDSKSSSESSDTGFAGTWKILEYDGSYTCESGDSGAEGTTTYTITITVDGDGIALVNQDGETGTGTVVDNTATVIITKTDEEDGTSVTTLNLSLGENDSLTAEGSWVENEGTADECSGTFMLNGIKETGTSASDETTAEIRLLCQGDWVQVNFLGTDEDGNVEEWDADCTDPEGIGFVASISESEWVEQDGYGTGSVCRYSYTIRGNRFVLTGISTTLYYPWDFTEYTESGTLEFPDNDTMIEWYDYPAGATNEIVAFKWKRK